MFETKTKGIRIVATPEFIPERSDLENGQFFFSYQIDIFNEGEQTVQLVSRHWIITDANGKVEEVEGPGVIGEQPILKPGEHFTYTSFCPLTTEVGSMRGTYQMVSEEEGNFDVVNPTFTLALPNSLN